jgi:hypothetical protein
MTTLQVSNLETVSFIDSEQGAEIWQGNDLIAVVRRQSASLFDENRAAILTT